VKSDALETCFTHLLSHAGTIFKRIVLVNQGLKSCLVKGRLKGKAVGVLSRGSEGHSRP